MEITKVTLRPVAMNKVCAIASIVIDDCFVVHDLRVVNGDKGLFVAMPSRKLPSGEFRDICHPINTEARSDDPRRRARPVPGRGRGRVRSRRRPRRRSRAARGLGRDRHGVCGRRTRSGAPAPRSSRLLTRRSGTPYTGRASVGASSNGRTRDFGSRYPGSNPGAPATPPPRAAEKRRVLHAAEEGAADDAPPL